MLFYLEFRVKKIGLARPKGPNSKSFNIYIYNKI